jgi:hypothetical protein
LPLLWHPSSEPRSNFLQAKQGKINQGSNKTPLPFLEQKERALVFAGSQDPAEQSDGWKNILNANGDQ